MKRPSATPRGRAVVPGGSVAAPRSLSAALAPIVLPDSDGRPVRLGSLWEARPAVVVFLRHYG